MTNIIWRIAGSAICATALIAASAHLADAAPARVGTRTNLRLGPGTNFGIAVTVPAGSLVDVIRCGPEWCNVRFAGRPGYMIGRNLGRVGPPVGGPPRVVVVEPAPPVVVVGPRYGYYGYYGPRYYGYRRGWGRW
jgi:hypothetical protein